jgi:GxxExxY protein
MKSFAAKDAKDAKGDMNEEEIGRHIVDACIRVHSILGAGLLEGVYESCLAYELEKRAMNVKRQLALPIVYDDLKVDNAFRIDLLVGDKVVIELKAVDGLSPVHSAQLFSYMKLGKYKLGFLLNFNVVHMKDGIKRMVNGL